MDMRTVWSNAMLCLHPVPRAHTPVFLAAFAVGRNCPTTRLRSGAGTMDTTSACNHNAAIVEVHNTRPHLIIKVTRNS